MKTIREAIAERGPKWGGFFDALYWNESEGYYFAVENYRLSEFVCCKNEYETVAKELNKALADTHNRNTALTVELNEFCQQQGIGKIGDSIVPAIKTYITNIQASLDLTERLIISEIGDFSAGLGNLGEPQMPEQIHGQLMARVQRVFADVRLQEDADVQQQLHEKPSITVKELHKEHWLVKAGYAMASAHASYETLLPAVEEVTEEYPQLSNELAIAMWVAVNAKSKAGAK